MRIKRIEIIGFKSFCDRTVLIFDVPITGIVGPNGCGKSNVVDAIRWCMGEQSAKHLRGNAMADVIFAGSETRGPAGMAEVSLTFEQVGFSNETLELALDSEDVLRDPALATLPEAEPEGASGVPETGADAQTTPSDGSSAPAKKQVVVVAPTATQEVEAMLATKPPAIDFAQYSEVTITRRLFRDGASGYFLNKTPCRLRDITDFFLGTGVGTKAYSIIEQGRIGMIVSARAVDRRYIIEEAAGITKFKAKKRAAERKLEQTKHNLLRVSDIVEELSKRIGSLRRQAQKAERYRRYKAEVRDTEMWIASHKLLEIQAEEMQLSLELETEANRLTSARAEFEARDGKVVAERAELSVEERRLSELQEQIYELENRIKLSENKVEFQLREADELEQRVANASGEIKSLLTQRNDASDDLDKQMVELDRLDEHMRNEELESAEREAAFAEARQMVANARSVLEEARNELSSAHADLARADSRRDAAERRREDSAGRLERVVEETTVATERGAHLENQVKGCDSGLASLRQLRLGLDSQSTDLTVRQSELEEQVHNSEAEVETLRTELHRRRSRLQSLKEIHDKYEGFARGTRSVMQHSGEFGADRVKEIRGLVADVVDAPEKLEVAVEAALGDRLGGILVNEAEVGFRAIQYLKDTSGGRSAFVPMSLTVASGAGHIEVQDLTGTSAAAGEGVLGPLVDLVSFEEGFGTVARGLLGNTIVVETLRRALELRDAGVVQTMVTLEGDIVDERGVVTGGSCESQGASVLAQKREIRELAEITDGLDGDLADATARFIVAKGEFVKVGRALEALKNDSHDGDIQMIAHEKELSGARGELERIRERLVRLNAEQLELDERMADVGREQTEVEEMQRSAEQCIARIQGDQQKMIDSVTEAETRQEEVQLQVTDARIKVAQLGEKRASIEATALRLEKVDRELNERIERLERLIGDSTQRAKSLREDCNNMGDELVETRHQRRELAEQITEGRTNYDQRVADLQVEEVEARKLRLMAEQLATEVAAYEMKLVTLITNRDHLESSIDDRYSVELRKHVGDYHLRPQVGPDELRQLEDRKRLIARMGADINLTAIGEFQEISQRHEFLSTQRKDLDNAVGQLERAISKINRTSRKLFRDTFNAVNAGFAEMFPKLFRGGKAKLVLTGEDGDDILDAGVEILAQPPGKKNVTVDQLSGGEKALTAVALIFAIFLIKPSPFCLLDEVDAPLDEVNVRRYNEVLREMTDRSQFIVITHNKSTMEIVDRLFGVTMQEPGVSKLVTVNLNKIGKVAAA